MLASSSQITGRSVLVTQDTVPPLTLGDHNNVPAPLKLHNLGVFFDNLSPRVIRLCPLPLSRPRQHLGVTLSPHDKSHKTSALAPN